MSKQDKRELTKWGNKWKLWKILHPDYTERHRLFIFQDMCHKCIFIPIWSVGVSFNINILHCPLNRLITEDFKKVITFDSKERISKEEPLCIEWIKHV
jgi:hypothetical protein